MTTNILFAVVVSLATNVTERFPQHQVPDPVPPSTDGWTHSIYRFHYENEPNPDRKWVRTTVTRTRSLRGEFEGAKLDFPLGTDTLSDVEVEHKVQRTEAWTPTATNDLAGKQFVGGAWYPAATNWTATTYRLTVSNLCCTNVLSGTNVSNETSTSWEWR